MGAIEMETDLEKLEESLWRAATRFDRNYMDRVLAPDFFEFGRSGQRYTREQCLDVGDKREINAKLPLEAFALHLIDETTALVTYISEVAYETAQRANRSSIWSLTPDGWKLRFHQGTPTL
jgi:hypothetical protein